MTRSTWKGPYISESLTKSLKSNSRTIKTWSRSSVIHPEFLGKTFEVYNGQKFIAVKVTEDMIGHKLGEFSLTKKNVIHKKK